MRVALVYPPDFNRPTMVFGALPLLNACLKSAGHETRLVDLGAEAFAFCLRDGNLERYFALLDQTVARLGDDDGETARGYRRAQAYPRRLMMQARDAAEGMRDPERMLDPREYRRMDRIIRTTHAFLNSFTPVLDPRNKSFTDDLYLFLERDTLDPYYEYYEGDVIRHFVHEYPPDFIAMSCPFSPQVATGMYFARQVRRHLPHMRFVMGGTGVSDSAELILGDARFFDYVDFAIVGDGEEALCELVASLEWRGDLDSVPGLWRRDGEAIVRPSHHRNVDLDATPTPDYTEVDFSPYMLPEPAGIYTTSRGCYYGKCTFCPESFRLGFRKRSPERVWEDMLGLLEQGVRNVHFFDPLTPPVTLEYVARRVAAEDLDLSWYAQVKFEKIYANREYVRKLAAGGCRQLQFGFESGVQRVLDLMKKGNRLDLVDVVLRNLKEFGITMVGTWFIGFPGETEEDARATWRFWRDHADSMHLSLYTGTFSLGPEVPVFVNPEEYGVEIVYAEDGFARCVPLDGDDWDKGDLHTAFHVRSDIEVTICGAGLLYAKHAPERLYALRNVNAIGPTSFDEPPLASRRCRFGEENALFELREDGVLKRFAFVAESLRTFELDDEEVRLIEQFAAHPDGLLAAEVLRAHPGAVARLARLVDRGILESSDPESMRLLEGLASTMRG